MKLSKTKKTALFFMAATLASSGVYAAEFATPKDYNIVLIDGAKAGSFLSDSNEIQLSSGQHQVVVVFKGLFKRGSDSMMVSAANPLVIKLPNVKDSDNITFSYHRIRNYEEAQDYADDQKITLTNNGTIAGKETASYFILQSDKGFQLDRDYLSELKSLGLLYVSKENVIKEKDNTDKLKNCRSSGFRDCPNTVKASSVTEQQNDQQIKPDKTNEPKVPESKQVSGKVNTGILEGMKSIYNSADKQTKAAFKEWLNKEKK